MKIYLLRHGDAADHDDPRYPTDAVRPLTPKGIKRTRQLANGLRQMDLTFDVIYSSPLLRAKQTAEIVARSLKLEKKLHFTHHLAPEGAFVDMIAQVEHARPAVKTVLLVGHEPFLSGLISLLCTGGPALGLTMKKGGFCKLEVATLKPGRCAMLEWLLTPRHFAPKRSAKAR
jgi:phosphohistidine phosphatase